MYRFLTNNLLGLVASGLLLTAGVARASLTETFTATHAPSTTDWSDNFVLQQFDPTLGTLESVNVTATENVNMSGTIQNYATVSESFSISDGSVLTITLPGSLGVLNASAMSTQLFSLASGASAPFGPTNAPASASATFTSPGDLSWFVGAGTFSLPGQTVSSEMITGGGDNLTALINTTAGATVQVQYTYNAAVPEPGTFATGALLLAGLLVRRRP